MRRALQAQADEEGEAPQEGMNSERLSACKRDQGQTGLVRAPGDVANVFERALAEFPQWHPAAIRRDPFVMTMDGFVSDHEIDVLLGA